MNKVKDCSILIYIIDELAKKDFKDGFYYKDKKLPYELYIETSWGFNKKTYNWELRMKYQSNPTVILKVSDLTHGETKAKLIACKELERYTKNLIHILREQYDTDVIKRVELLIVRSVISKYHGSTILVARKEFIEKIVKACDRKRKNLLGAKGSKGWVQENIKIIMLEKGILNTEWK